MEEFVAYVKHTIVRLLVMALAGTVVIAVSGYSIYLSGWLIGNLVNLLYFIMLSNRLAKSSKMAPERALLFNRGGAAVRLFFIALVLIVVLQFPQIRILPFVAGVMMYRILIFGETLVSALRHTK